MSTTLASGNVGDTWVVLVVGEQDGPVRVYLEARAPESTHRWRLDLCATCAGWRMADTSEPAAPPASYARCICPPAVSS